MGVAGHHDARAARCRLQTDDRIELIAREAGIDCDFARLDGFLLASIGRDPDHLVGELEAAHAAGLTAVELRPRAPLGFDAGPCLRFPGQGIVEPSRYLRGLARAAEVMETMDGLTFIGPVTPGSRTFVITADRGDGYTHATLGAILAADSVARPRQPVGRDVRALARACALTTFAAENVNVASQLTEWLTKGDAPDAGHVPVATGAVVRRGLAPVAVYRGADGVVHERSAVCPHLGCIVRWNASEASWDCPCHGYSRFDPRGRLLNGSAHSDLAPIVPDEHVVTH